MLSAKPFESNVYVGTQYTEATNLDSLCMLTTECV